MKTTRVVDLHSVITVVKDIVKSAALSASKSQSIEYRRDIKSHAAAISDLLKVTFSLLAFRCSVRLSSSLLHAHTYFDADMSSLYRSM
jgi:hypothetical protein